MELIQQFTENETYLFALRQQFTVRILLSIPDVPKRDIDLAKGSETLESVLRDPMGGIFFNQFLRVSRSLGLAMFLDEVLQYEELPKGPYRIRVCKKIVYKYLCDDSKMGLTLPDESRALVMFKLENARDFDNIFSSVKRSIQRDLLVGFFPMFLESRYYSRLLAFRTKELMAVRRQDFEFLRVLGKGGFGKVYAIRKMDTCQMYACKEMSKAKITERKREMLLQNERYFLTRVTHPFIVGLHYAFQDAYNLYFVMDLVTGGELEYHLHNRGQFPTDWVQFYVAGMAMAIEYLHKHEIVYRDLKLENVLLDADGFIKLADLGLCSSLSEGQQLFDHCGTRSFMAPEQCTSGYGFEVDWWALGVCTYRMLTHKNPFSKMWHEHEKPKEGRVMSFLASSIRRLSNLRASFSRRERPHVGPGNNDRLEDADEVDIGDNLNENAIRRRKTKMLRNMFDMMVKQITWPDKISESAKSFVRSTLQINPNHRLGHNGAAEVKKHEFFKGFDWNRLERRYMVPPLVPSTGSVNAEYVEPPATPSKWKHYDKVVDFDYVAHHSFQKEIVNSMYDMNDLILYRRHARRKKLTSMI